MTGGRSLHASLVMPLALSALVVFSAALEQSSIRDAVTGATPHGMTLVLPALYVVLSPLSRALDTIALLSVAQHIGVGLLLVVAALLTRSVKSAVMIAVVTIVLYTCAAALPRPMARLVVADPNVVVVDFHSHTNASGDARRSFSPEANRAWHDEGGFNVAYVSDHRTFAGAVTALAENVDPPGGNDIVLLSAYEGRYLGTFEIFIGLTREDSAALINNRKHLRDGMMRSGRLPTSIVALPAPLSDVQSVGRDNPPHIVGIELNDGSPRGFLQADRDRRTIINRADSLGVALVSGSNNHGWGRVVSAWTLLTIPGWRSLTPDSLGASIENTLRATPRRVQVVERRRPTMSSPFTVTAALPVAAGLLLTTLTITERAVWLIWIWGLWALWRGARAMRTRRQSTSAIVKPS